MWFLVLGYTVCARYEGTRHSCSCSMMFLRENVAHNLFSLDDENESDEVVRSTVLYRFYSVPADDER
jgi:hypothetical protein